MFGVARARFASALSYITPSGRFTTNISTNRLAKKVAVVAIFAIALSSQFAQAVAGPGAFALCMAECTALTMGGFIPGCVAVCAPLFAAPTP